MHGVFSKKREKNNRIKCLKFLKAKMKYIKKQKESTNCPDIDT